MLKIKRSRVRTGPVKKWTDEEGLSIIYYILDKKNDGKPFEKPTAEMFYNKMINALKLNVKWQQVKAKMNNFRAKFLQVKTWLEGTGQGVDYGTIEEYKLSKCPLYDLLHSIYGSKANISIPSQYDSLRANDSMGNDSSKDETCTQANVDFNVVNEDDSQGNDGINVGNGYGHEESDEGLRANADSSQGNDINVENVDAHPGNVASLPASEDCSQGNDGINVENEDGHEENVGSLTANEDASQGIICCEIDESDNRPVVQETHSNGGQNKRSLTKDTGPSEEDYNFARFAQDRDEEQEEIASSRLARFKKQLSERPSGKQTKREIPSNASAFISDANMKRAETLHERNQIELRRVENERLEMDISKERFQLDKILHMEQLTLSKKEVSLKDQELLLKEKEQQEKLVPLQKFKQKRRGGNINQSSIETINFWHLPLKRWVRGVPRQ